VALRGKQVRGFWICGSSTHVPAIAFSLCCQDISPRHIMRSHHNRCILLKTALPDKCGDALLNTLAIGDKGGERVMKVRTEVRPEGLVGNATGDLLSIRYRQKPEHPFSCIISFTGWEFYMHETPAFTRRAPF
jgi:hypothetical protein